MVTPLSIGELELEAQKAMLKLEPLNIITISLPLLSQTMILWVTEKDFQQQKGRIYSQENAHKIHGFK